MLSADCFRAVSRSRVSPFKLVLGCLILCELGAFSVGNLLSWRAPSLESACQPDSELLQVLRAGSSDSLLRAFVISYGFQ